MYRTFSTAAALVLCASGLMAAPVAYDFKAEAEGSGQIGESIFATFSTSGNGVFAGPNLDVTATKAGAAAFVYMDARNAGMGVCGTAKNAAQINKYAPGNTANRCNPSSDDGLTTTDETLHFKATSQNLVIKSFYINSNHDTSSGPVTSTVWNIGGVEYSMSDFVSDSLSGSGDIRIDVDFKLLAGETLTLRGVKGPNSYVSAMIVAPIPLPAGGLLLLTGAGALTLLRRRRRA